MLIHRYIIKYNAIILTQLQTLSGFATFSSFILFLLQSRIQKSHLVFNIWNPPSPDLENRVLTEYAPSPCEVQNTGVGSAKCLREAWPCPEWNPRPVKWMAVGTKHKSTLQTIKNIPAARSFIHSSAFQKAFPEGQPGLRHCGRHGATQVSPIPRLPTFLLS